MAKVKTKNPVAQKRVNKMDVADLYERASERIALPDDVTMRFDYQDDVDTLCIRFEGNVSSSLVSETDELENGVIGIYEGKKLVGLEILDFSGQLEYANPH